MYTHTHIMNYIFLQRGKNIMYKTKESTTVVGGMK